MLKLGVIVQYMLKEGRNLFFSSYTTHISSDRICGQHGVREGQISKRK
jgi:hypothetical protein